MGSVDESAARDKGTDDQVNLAVYQVADLFKVDDDSPQVAL